uniref:Integrin alpha-X-like isoform X1 n=2 Tax=Pogona vitticeps TaxID=103695 RepID=A0ABM5EIK0_9SAUR
MGFLLLLFYLGTGLMPWCYGFSVDEETSTIFRMPAESFGTSVAQTTNALFVGAPFQSGKMNETGKLYQCTYRTGACKEINIQPPTDAVNMSLGLTLTARDDQVLVCGPTLHRACGQNMFVNGYCFFLDHNLQQNLHFPEKLPECTVHPTDIAFLIDGSGSIDSDDFETMKRFVSEIIQRLSGKDTRFALMQFSDEFREHFNFNSRDPARHVMDIDQIGGWTHTATAIRKVLRELFTPQKGSRKGANKILIVITDGQKTDYLQYGQVIPEAEQAAIIRYAIGVGSAFSSRSARQELSDMASKPDSEHVFTVYNFNALQGIQDQLQDKIFAIEGTQYQSSSSFQMEMSQEGFSALLTPEGSVLGAVGSNDWSGGVLIYQNNNRNPKFINVSDTAGDMENAYLGYSSQFVQLRGRSGLVVGAPRYNYVGKIALFEKQTRRGRWQLKTEAVGEQVGAYFGATLCSVDLDQDTNTDLVLVGAPMYYDGAKGGRVYVCHFQEEALHCYTTLEGQRGHIFGRFGASIAAVGDITGDVWADVAIGSPLEDENAGAVYLFAGKQKSINPQYIQRIKGLTYSRRLLYFGQAISGGTDLTGDGLNDIVVGQQEQVVLMRTRPILHVEVSIEFDPPLIPTSVFKCQGQEEYSEEVTNVAKVCFSVSKATWDKLGTIFSDLQYSLALDPERIHARVSFSSGVPALSKSLQIGLEQQCQDHPIKLPICIEDTLTPIILQLNYSLVGKPIAKAKNLRPILSEESQKIYTAKLPFEKNCGSDGKCEDILRTSFNLSGLDTLVVGLTSEVNIIASIQNHGEDSYGTILRFFYPGGLSYRKVTLLQPSRKAVNIKCHSSPVTEEDADRNATCSINHPIFWSGAEAIFAATFDISPDADLGGTLRITAKAISENGGNITKDMVHEVDLPVKYAVYIIVTTLEESTKYVNFTAGQQEGSKSMEHRYEIKNLRERSIPVSVMFQIPVKLKGIQVWNVSQVISSEPHQAKCVLEKETAGSKDFPTKEVHPLLDCTTASCKMIRCDLLLLKLEKSLEFTIKGNIGFQWASKIHQRKVTLVSSAQIFYDDTKYAQKEGFVQTQVLTVVERIEIYNYLPVTIGGTAGGLVLLSLIAAVLYKLGFFKRQYKQMLSEAGDDNENAEPTSPTTQKADSSPPDKDIVD